MAMTVRESKALAFSEEDVGNIVLMEHVNVQVPDQSLATLFYLVGMGFTRDPHMMVGVDNMWVNLGEQQFHLPTAPAQVLRGHVGVVTPSLDALAERLEAVAPRLDGTEFSWKREGDHIDVTSPWGNLLRCYEPSPELGNIVQGIPYIEFTVPRGTAEGIALFYEKAMLAPGRVEKSDGGKCAVIDVGTYQRLIYREVDEVPEYDNHHLAVYIANFSAVHSFLADRGLVTEEPANHQLRFKDIVHPESGEQLFTIEHEVRSMRHPGFRRPLVNRSTGQLEPRRVGNQTVLVRN
jgi:hypothetical protein